jgi:hypothetical protein
VGISGLPEPHGLRAEESFTFSSARLPLAPATDRYSPRAHGVEGVAMEFIITLLLAGGAVLGLAARCGMLIGLL